MPEPAPRRRGLMRRVSIQSKLLLMLALTSLFGTKLLTVLQPLLVLFFA